MRLDEGTRRVDLEFSLAQLFSEIAELVQGALATLSLCGRLGGGSRRGVERRAGRRPEPDPADIQIFLETVKLEEVR